jgi:glucosamine--fructose-6-phosphate aminotransferase (isomerizing)
MTIAVTNDSRSALARTAEHHVDIRAGAERAVAATKSYTAQLLALYLLLVGEDAGAVPEAAAQTLDFADHAYSAAGRYRYAQRLLTTARGFSYATAREAALKVMETSYVSAQAFSGADLLHGPMAMVDAELPVIAVVTPSIGGRSMAPVLERLAAAGADVLRVGDEGGLPVAVDGIDERLLPILEVLPLQQLAWRLALDRGGDPDRPRGLSKITETW